MFGCLNPVKVKDPVKSTFVRGKFRDYGKVVYMEVPCRKCAYCLSVRKNELVSMIDREMKDPRNSSVYFMDLDYSNHYLPVYYFDKRSNKWRSNRERYTKVLPVSKSRLHSRVESCYPPLDFNEVDSYYLPVNYTKYSQCFGHLCYQDVQKLFNNVKSRLYINIKRKKTIIFDDYEQVKFRYFVCGEYGPTTFRPHYHVLLWFPQKYTSEQLNYIRQIFSSCWSFGRFNLDTIRTGSAGKYVASYITSFSSCPKILQSKSLRPFSRYSKAPTLGAYKLDKKEIQKSFASGVVKRVKWDDKRKSFVDDALPSSVFRRYFPKIRGFNRKDFNSKLSVYSYVYNQYKNGRININSVDDIYKLRLCDIDFAPYYDRDFDEYIEVWHYTDMYASLCFFRYCLLFNVDPVRLLTSFIRIYSKKSLSGLARHYTQVCEAFNTQPLFCSTSDIVGSPIFINHCPGTLYDLPQCLSRLKVNIFSFLVFYGIDIDRLYPLGILNEDYRDTLLLKNDPHYLAHVDKYQSLFFDSIKKKKYNDYRSNIGNSLYHFVYNEEKNCFIRKIV